MLSLTIKIPFRTIISLLLLAMFFSCEDETTTIEVEVHPLSEKWEKVIPHQKIPEGLVSLSAEDCGICHQQHYEEWKYSTHSHAWTDMQFQAEIKKESSPFFCINCHIPLQNQQELIVSGKIGNDIYQPVTKKNPHFDKKLQQEGITCAACHVRDGFIIGTQGSEIAPHPVKKDPEFLSENLCIACHTANAAVTPTVVCSFETGDEWKNGPYFKQQNCIDCHMEDTSRSLMVGLPVRKSHFHYFPGSGIPKEAGALTKGLEGLKIETNELSSSYRQNDSAVFAIHLTNEHAGHNLPTGDPERFYIVELIIEENDKVIHTQQFKIGEQWQWYPEAKKLDDNNLRPNEKRSFIIHFLPKNTGTFIIRYKVTKHRMNEEAATFNQLPPTYPLFITIYNESKSFKVVN